VLQRLRALACEPINLAEAEPNYPMIADVDYHVSKLYGMLPAPVSGDPTKRTATDNQTVRNVFVIGRDKKDQVDAGVPHDHGAQLRRGAARDLLASAHR